MMYLGALNIRQSLRSLCCAMLLCLLCCYQAHSQFCNAEGNLLLFSNYQGGIIHINVDVDVPDMKIGVCSRANCHIYIEGPYAANVTEVIYAGSAQPNDYCQLGVSSVQVFGVDASITSILDEPQGVLIGEGSGNDLIKCAYSCDDDWQGGCNTSDQIVAFFESETGGVLRSYVTQYSCWIGESYFASNTPCCGIAAIPYILQDDYLLCVGQCATLMEQGFGGYTFWLWTFDNANINVSYEQNPTVFFTTAGMHDVTLTAANQYGNNTRHYHVEVIACGTLGCTYPEAANYDPAASIDDGSCVYNPCTAPCMGDMDDDGIVSVSDLIIFIALYGSACAE